MCGKKRGIVLLILYFFTMTTLADVTVTMYGIKNKKDIGTITFKDTLQGLMVTPNLHDLPAGMHGMHLHVVPSCKHSGDSAGGHYDPNKTGKHLGPYNTNGHLGDLPALYVDQKGVANHAILAPRLKENNLYGHAVIIHAGDDNYSDFPAPLGGGGARIACGVIKNTSNK